MFKQLKLEFNNDEADLLLSMLQMMNIEERTTIYRKGDPGEALFIVQHGKVYMTIPNPIYCPKPISKINYEPDLKRNNSFIMSNDG